jgi:predicted dithiol-disulfide oxidoreductase (DUF899 family)
MEKFHGKRFPNETQHYRDTRNELLAAEIELRKKTEEVAALRRTLPYGGKVKEDYEFEEMDKGGNIRRTKLSGLFSDGKDTLIIYSFMYGPNDKKPCVYCNSIADGLSGMIFHTNDKINFVICAKAPIEKMMEWASGRGWGNLRILSSGKNTYNTDYFAENEKGSQLPMLNVFQKTADGIYHFYGSELLYVKFDDGMDARHVDSIWPVWNILDFTPDGRGPKWNPKHSYEK